MDIWKYFQVFTEKKTENKLNYNWNIWNLIINGNLLISITLIFKMFLVWHDTTNLDGSGGKVSLANHFISGLVQLLNGVSMSSNFSLKCLVFLDLRLKQESYMCNPCQPH